MIPEIDLKKRCYTVTRVRRGLMGRKMRIDVIGHFSNEECALLAAADRGRYGMKINGIEVTREEMDQAIDRHIMRNNECFSMAHSAVM